MQLRREVWISSSLMSQPPYPSPTHPREVNGNFIQSGIHCLDTYNSQSGFKQKPRIHFHCCTSLPKYYKKCIMGGRVWNACNSQSFTHVIVSQLVSTARQCYMSRHSHHQHNDSQCRQPWLPYQYTHKHCTFMQLKYSRRDSETHSIPNCLNC